MQFINNLSQQISVPEMIQHAEVLFYAFRDAISRAIPKERDLDIRFNSSVESHLNNITGMFPKELLLDNEGLHCMSNLKEEEWIELIPLLETKN
jgi:hypothetical protein